MLKDEEKSSDLIERDQTILKLDPCRDGHYSAKCSKQQDRMVIPPLRRSRRLAVINPSVKKSSVDCFCLNLQHLRDRSPLHSDPR
jgi:hypothetical protein